MTTETRFIVAEISKNWINGEAFNGEPILLSQLFERVIEGNRQRGYRLHSFQLHRLLSTTARGNGADPDVDLNETILAVFERETSHATQ